MSIKARIDKLLQAAGRDIPANAAPLYDADALRKLSPEELLRTLRRALADDGDAPQPRLVDELRRLPPEVLLERHRAALGFVGEK